MSELFDGLVFCGECEMPMLSDGKGFYRHIIDLPRKRLKELLKDGQVAGKVFDWLCSMKVECPCHGPQPNPFKELPREEVVAHLGTGRGANDLFQTLRDLFHQPLGHTGELKAEDAIAEAERIIREKGE